MTEPATPSPPLRIAFIGCVQSSQIALQALLDLPGEAQWVALVTRRASTYNADFVDIAPLAMARNVSVAYVEDIPDDNAQAAFLSATAPDLIFCVGWSRLLGSAVLAVPRLGVVGYHPAALPANRGRHPLIWALVLGLTETASSFFLMGDTADSGPILSQTPIPITDQDNAASLYAKVLAVIPAQIADITRGLHQGTLQPRQQNASRASHWRKRTAADGQIDWRMSAETIYNLVRALSQPYPGAHFVYQGQEIKLWRCAVVDHADPNAEPGKVLASGQGFLIVKCGDGALRLIEHGLDELPAVGAYL